MIDIAWEQKQPCWLCGQGFRSKSEITADHVVPIIHGGGPELSNLRPAHAAHNSSRGARSRPSRVIPRTQR